MTLISATAPKANAFIHTLGQVHRRRGHRCDAFGHRRHSRRIGATGNPMSYGETLGRTDQYSTQLRNSRSQCFDILLECLWVCHSFSYKISIIVIRSIALTFGPAIA